MLALASNTGFEAMTADELYYINGGSSSFHVGAEYKNPYNWTIGYNYETDKGSGYGVVSVHDGIINVDFGGTKK